MKVLSMQESLKKRISVLIPCYNEELSLPILYKALDTVSKESQNYEWEFLFVNDGSKDHTLKILRELSSIDHRVGYLDLSRNFGKEAAMLAGFDNVKGDCMVILDADLQHPPLLILDMIKEWENGYEDVYGKRISRGKESWLRKKLSLTFYKILQKNSNIDILPNVGDFRLLDKRCIDTLRNLRESERYTKGMFSWIGFKKKEILFNTADRVAGSSHWKFSSLFKLAIEGITSFTTAPLRISTILGFLISFLAFIYMIFILIRTVFFGDEVRGFPTLVILILFLGGIQLISLGIIGEYIARIFTESKNRPVYVIRESKLSK